MKQITILTILISVNLFSVSCVNNSPTLVDETESTTNPKFIIATPEPYLLVPNGWVLIPKPNANEIRCGNWSNREWKIDYDNNLKFSKYAYLESEQIAKLPVKLREFILKNRNIGKGLAGYIHASPTENGWLVGSDAGEWGGNLFWFSEDGNKKIELLGENVRGIIHLGENIFILSGLAHLSSDEGQIHKLARDEMGTLKTQSIFNLKGQPQSFAVEGKDSLIIILNNRILRLNKHGEVKVLKEINFESLYPNSMAITSSGVIYVGMRLFVARFIPNEDSYMEEWLVPQDCQKFVARDMQCLCQKK
ncbi:MAG: hypothetical protein WKF92_10390 [Pyrinomonadaceae bacterium]